MSMPEQWRDVPGWEGRYRVSDLGRVQSVSTSRIMRPHIVKGYTTLLLYRGGRYTHQFVHRLVLAAFVGPCPTGMETRHLNGDRSDNRRRNLRYGTKAENMQDRLRHGRNPSVNKTHCPQGHPYSGEHLYITPTGARNCRTCRRSHLRAWRARQAAA